VSYKKSDSRKSFECRVEKLRVSSRIASVGVNNIPREVRDLSFHAAILETSAALEEYVKNFLEDYIFILKVRGVSIGDLPREIRTFFLIKKTLPHYENLAFSRDEKRALEKLNIDSEAFYLLDPGALVDQSFKVDILLDKKKYPSPKNWNVLFYRLGVKDIFSATEKRLRRDTKSLLQSFNDIRTALAHGEPPGLTYNDVFRQISNMQSLVGAIDRVLCTHICKYTGKDTWPA
jgi:hypothetical protein